MRIIIILMIGLSLNVDAFSQTLDPALRINDSTQTHIIETTRGDRFYGRVISINEEQVSFLFQGKQILTFKPAELISIKVFTTHLSQDDFFNPMYLSVFPTALNLRKGEWEYQNTSLLWNTLNYGVSDKFSIGGGFVIPFAFTLKLKGSTELFKKVHLGIQVNNIVPLVEETEPVSFITLSSTYGTAREFINIGVGYAANWYYPDDSATYFSIGASKMLGTYIGANGELNLFRVDDTDYIFPILNIFYHRNKIRINLGIGLNNTGELPEVNALPILSFVHRF